MFSLLSVPDISSTQVNEDCRYSLTTSMLQVLSMYLSCSGYTEVTNSCLDRVVCEYANTQNSVSDEERDVISM